MTRPGSIPQHESVHGRAARTLALLLAMLMALPAPFATAGLLGDTVSSFKVTADLSRRSSQENAVTQAAAILTTVIAADGNPFPKAPAFTTGAGPVGGGLMPTGTAAPMTDSHLGKLGYCSWDNGPVAAGGNRTPGSATNVGAPVFAVVSAGLDGIFNRTCAEIVAGTNTGNDDYAVWKSTMQIKFGVAGTVYFSDPVTDKAALDLLTGLKDGEMRLIKSNNALWRWDTNVAGANKWTSVSNTYTASNVDVTGGQINGTQIGNITPSTGAFTTLTTPNATITGGTLNGTSIGATVASTGTFTTLAATGAFSAAGNATFGGNLNAAGIVTAGSFAGSGAALNNLNGSAITSGVVAPAFGGTGVNASAAPAGALLIGNGSGFTLGALAAGAGIGITSGPGSISIANTGVTSFNARTGAVSLTLADVNNVTGFASNNTTLGINALSPTSTGSGNTAVGYAALQANTTGYANVAIGENALRSNTTGNSNAASGSSALTNNTSGAYNLASGFQAMASNTTGFSNVALGYQALFSATTAYHNVAIGERALTSTTTGVDNVASGFGALRLNTTGSSNVASGSYALFANTTGYANVAVGYGVLANNTIGVGNTASGNNAMNANTTASNGSAFGSGALLSNTTGSGNSAFGNNALFANTTGNSNVAVGYSVLASNTTGFGNTASGNNAMNANTTGFGNTASGNYAMHANTTASGGSAFGSGALGSNTTGSSNSAFGNNALFSNTTGFGNTAAGQSSLYYNSTGSNNVAFGYRALVTNSTGNDNTAIGKEALLYSTGSNNTATGSASLYSTTTGSGNTAAGNSSLYYNSTGSNNVAFGYRALVTNSTGNDNTAIGKEALLYSTGSNNTATGSASLYSTTTGSGNTAAGNSSLYYNSTGSNNVAFGYRALVTNSTGNDNTAIGKEALLYSTGSSNTAIGSITMYRNTTGSGNTAVGYSSFYNNLTGSGNVAFGLQALNANQAGDSSTAIGNSALSSSTGSNNVALGASAGASNTSGTNNTFLGMNANAAGGLLSNSTALGSGSVVSTSSTIVLGRTTDKTVIGATGDDSSGNALQVTGGIKSTATMTADSAVLTGKNGNTLLLRTTTMTGGESTSITFADPDGGTQPVSIRYSDNGNASLQIVGGKFGIGAEADGSAYNLQVTGGIKALTGGIKIGAGTASIAPLTLQAGVNLTTPAAGAVEYDGSNLYFTPAAARKTVAFLDSNITGTSGNVTGIVAPANGGTGINGSTAGNGTLLIGNSTGYTLANLTAGSGIGITNGAGSITITSTPPLSSITAATASNTINNGANAQTWNWQLTGNTTAFNLGENVASAGGTGTQYLAKVGTLAGSTAIPLSVTTSGIEAFRIDSVNPQIVANVGTAAAPSYSFNGNQSTGFYAPAANELGASINGTRAMRVTANGNVALGGGEFACR